MCDGDDNDDDDSQVMLPVITTTNTDLRCLADAMAAGIEPSNQRMMKMTMMKICVAAELQKIRQLTAAGSCAQNTEAVRSEELWEMWFNFILLMSYDLFIYLLTYYLI